MISVRNIILIAILATVIVGGAWLLNFAEQDISTDGEHWSEFAGYISGILTPFFAFLSVLFLIQTVKLQNDANLALTQQNIDNKKLSVQASFESLFFNLIEIQSKDFARLKFHVQSSSDFTQFDCYESNEAVEFLIGKLEAFNRALLFPKATQLQAFDPPPFNPYRGELSIFQRKVKLIEQVNSERHLYNIVRAFSNIQRQINQWLTKERGFSVEDRERYYSNLISLTNFQLLMLLMIAIRYLPSRQTFKITSNEELMNVLKETKLLPFKDRI